MRKSFVYWIVANYRFEFLHFFRAEKTKWMDTLRERHKEGNTNLHEKSVTDPGGFLGFRGTPLFVVLRTCVAGLLRAHERSRNRSRQQRPLS